MTLTQAFTALAPQGGYLLWVIAPVLAIATLLKGWAVLRKVNLDGAVPLQSTLMTRIESLELRLAEVQTELRQEQDRHIAEMASKQAQHEAEMQIARHRLNNEKASLDALLMLLEANPERVTQSVQQIREMRAEQERAIAAEKGAMAGAKVKGAGA